MNLDRRVRISLVTKDDVSIGEALIPVDVLDGILLCDAAIRIPVKCPVHHGNLDHVALLIEPFDLGRELQALIPLEE